ncbi:hypothetical protein MTP09_07970 [Chryseobacterium suipulveris]|uniref:Cell wall anchor protein n=1 Tax=Chryseobacterium suipulveris TaxID=2929800 RepID=A0ABY4BKZ3_9FLAO|nr:hypothetical protein [Chryseobacterium suipulveris]UOE39862.1 hypothetical protein MTP09_07970 [Chryseobacterium suipulveris]
MKRILLLCSLAFSTLYYSQIPTGTRNDAGLQGDAGATNGFFETNKPVNYPEGATDWWHLLDVRHSNPSNNHAMQLAAAFWGQNLYFRNTNNSSSTPWNRVLTEDSEGKVRIGGSTTVDKVAITGSHTESTVLLQANNGGNPNAYLTLWASEPGASYTGTGIGNNVRNYYNGSPFQRIATDRRGSFMRLLDNHISLGIVPQSGIYKEALNLGPDGAGFSGNIHSVEGHLLSSKTTNEGGSLVLSNNNKTGQQYRTWIMYNMTGPYTNSLQFWNYSADGTKSVPRLKISDEGDMALYGKFEAKEVKVTASPTADFVFADGYPLPKLDEVEQFIKKNRHLPEVASAKEMERDGVNVGEFQIKLLQKIEELTLYTIEQGKMLKEQQRKLEEQQRKIEAMEKLVDQSKE